MTFKRTVTVTETQTAKVLMLKIKPGETTWDWCAECERQVAWLELTAAIEFLAVSEPFERSVVHWRSNRVCLRSLVE